MLLLLQFFFFFFGSQPPSRLFLFAWKPGPGPSVKHSCLCFTKEEHENVMVSKQCQFFLEYKFVWVVRAWRTALIYSSIIPFVYLYVCFKSIEGQFEMHKRSPIPRIRVKKQKVNLSQTNTEPFWWGWNSFYIQR